MEIYSTPKTKLEKNPLPEKPDYPRNKISDIVRWILLIPVTFGAWLGVVFGSVILGSPLFGAPAGSMSELFFIVASGISAVVVVIVSYYLAPKFKRIVCSIAYLVGTFFAAQIIFDQLHRSGFSGDMFIVFCSISAIFCGFFAVLYFHSRRNFLFN